MPSLGKDLSKIRSHLGFSIQDIQHVTKIPVDTLKKIEDGSIFDHPEDNQTYVRSFVRSFGRALKIDNDLLIKALDQNETGNYNELLLKEYPELTPNQSGLQENDPGSDLEEQKDQPENESNKESVDGDEGEEEDNDQKKTMKADTTDPSKHSSKEEVSGNDKSGTLSGKVKPRITSTEKSVSSIDWADVGRKFNQEKKQTPVWIIGLIIFLIITAILGYFLYENGMFPFQSMIESEPQDQVTTINNPSSNGLTLELSDSLSTSESINQSPSESREEPEAEMGDIMELTVYAAYDALGPVRVWSDVKPRMDPYWLDQGTAMRFEFEDTIRVRGSYSDLLLLKDGHLIENAAQEFLSQEENYIQITRNFFATDTKWATPVDYDLPEGVSPPDSIATRPTF